MPSIPTLCARTLLLAALMLVTASGARAQSRSILLLIADDVGVDVSEFYPTSAGRRVTTPPAPPMPALRRLAQRGVLFRDAWADPTCSPTRATIATGRYGFRTGVGVALPSSATGLSTGEFVLPEAFRARPALGYVLAHVGKWHLGRGTDGPNRHGWPYFAGPDPASGQVPDYFRWTKYVNGAATPSTTYATTDQVDEALGVIRQARAQGRPYFVEVWFNAPHAPYHKPPAELHSRDALPPYRSGANPRPYFEAMLEALDAEIGRLLREVDLATTTVIYVGDNGTDGPTVAAPYPRNRAKRTMYQGGLRVPLLVAGAGVAGPGRVVPHVVNTVDLFPTVLELAGIAPRAVVPAGTRIDGVSLMPYLRNATTRPLREWVYAEQFSGSYTRAQRAIRNARYKLIERPAGGAREFYDLQQDPLEAQNLLGGTLSAEQQANLAALDRQLDVLLATR